MTPQEKAKELVDKFYQTTPNEAWINEPLGISEEYKAWKQAKQCALIAVDEMYNIAHSLDDMATVGYLVDVKQEIEKL
jgi:hypothetical protein